MTSLASYAEPEAEEDFNTDRSQSEVAAWIVLAAGFIGAIFTPNPVLTAAALLVLPVLVALLWRRGEVPILFFAAAYQWLQVSTKVFRANTLGITVADAGVTPTVVSAVWLGLAAIVVLAVGMRWALRGLPMRAEEAETEASAIPPSRAFRLYLVSTAFGAAMHAVAWIVPGLTQIALGLEGMKWIGFFVLGYVVLSQRQGYLLFLAATAFEFIQGIGFFSGFKEVVFVAGISYLTVQSRMTTRAVLIGVVGLAFLFILGGAWTSIKGEYRSYLSQGDASQTVSVSREDQLSKMGQLVGGLTWEDIVLSIDPLLARIEYVDYFALSMDYVPAAVPHQQGRVWLEAVQNLIPRLIYPSKPVLTSDSEHTMEYTGQYMASDAEGTSISLGYVADSYVDFGPFFMFVPLLIAGFLWGWIYRYFQSRSASALIGFAFALAALLAASSFEIASVKLLAGVVVKFLALAVALKFLEPRICDWLTLSDFESDSDEVDDVSHASHEIPPALPRQLRSVR